ncbi:hypothetical protein BAUCODRAFT_245188 [Baudoinia panamericana UAMH 10762]|uniref:ELMO domain-containing protein n=1 Tax=Baudoinia panamericana (strain UAMH 10762) TaxID=717646 RepID=M2MQ20_BAUPA|nr:uncharacterized protein BAUCODRAFT_245188 [Baudoinia panamericana UAMH 10762]EMC93548.1 hypothetical protein BAUCODRAFT_245188 [Baudoinia panamericana UAMH 10762]
MMEDPPDVESLVSGLVSENDAARKYAVFKLQGMLSDPSFADAFIQGDGLLALRQAVLETTGNTQAYAFGSLDALLELDMGWEALDGPIIEKAVSLAVSHPLVNTVRNALTLLVLVVSRPLTGARRESNEASGFRAIKPALDSHPEFLECLVQRLSASDHLLCANALQLVNALMRDAVINGGEQEWPKFVRRLQDLGVIGGVGMLMRGDAAGDLSSPLASAILEFQNLTKVLLRKWKEVRVNVELPEHKRALKTIHLLSRPEPYNPPVADDDADGKPPKRHHPEKWRRLGFETESPAWEFDETGYLGMMDVVDYTKRNQDAYHKVLMEQSVQPKEQRCPIARASLSVTVILYEHFQIDEAIELGSAGSEARHMGSRPTDADTAYRPLLLQWGRLHVAALNAFLRIWKVAGAELEDFYKIDEIVRIIVERVVGTASRRTDVSKVEEELRSVTLETARKWQMEGLDDIYADAWGPHLQQVREQLHHESLQFMKEQRVRCLLKGAWFPASMATAGRTGPWRYVRLSHNRRWLHHLEYASKGSNEPALADLIEKIDLDVVTSVDSNVSASEEQQPLMNGDNSSSETLKDSQQHVGSTTTTKITVMGNASKSNTEESVLLELFPQTASEASEWLDGLLMLLNQQPITKDTTSLIDMMVDWGVRLRMLNLRWEDVDWDALDQRVNGVEIEAREVPSREGLDNDYYYAMPEA